MTTDVELDTRRDEGLAVLGDLPADALAMWECYGQKVTSPLAYVRRLYLAVRPLASSDADAMIRAIRYADYGVSEMLHEQENYARVAAQSAEFTRAVVENLRRRAGAD